MRNFQYIVAIVVMFLIATVSTVVITLARPDIDNGVVIAALFGVLTPTTVSLLAFMKAQETHLSVNSRLDDFIKNASGIARAEGKEEGLKERKTD